MQDLAKKKLERQLNMETRMEYVSENRKQDFYAREQLLQKIMAETDRVMSMQRSRAALQRQRREANMQARTCPVLRDCSCPSCCTTLPCSCAAAPCACARAAQLSVSNLSARC